MFVCVCVYLVVISYLGLPDAMDARHGLQVRLRCNTKMLIIAYFQCRKRSREICMSVSVNVLCALIT